MIAGVSRRARRRAEEASPGSQAAAVSPQLADVLSHLADLHSFRVASSAVSIGEVHHPSCIVHPLHVAASHPEVAVVPAGGSINFAGRLCAAARLGCDPPRAALRRIAEQRLLALFPSLIKFIAASAASLLSLCAPRLGACRLQARSTDLAKWRGGTLADMPIDIYRHRLTQSET
jgi:hypothetical protein